jgi:hypothetical protein
MYLRDNSDNAADFLRFDALLLGRLFMLLLFYYFYMCSITLIVTAVEMVLWKSKGVVK